MNYVSNFDYQEFLIKVYPRVKDGEILIIDVSQGFIDFMKTVINKDHYDTFSKIRPEDMIVEFRKYHNKMGGKFDVFYTQKKRYIKDRLPSFSYEVMLEQ
jgi:predicted methyltransferase